MTLSMTGVDLSGYSKSGTADVIQLNSSEFVYVTRSSR